MAKSKPLVIFAFSNASNSEIYDAIVHEISALDINLVCIYYGNATEPIRKHAESLNVQTWHYNLETSYSKIRAALVTCRLFILNRPSLVFGFGQSATLLAFLSSILVPKTTRVYLRQHTSSNRSQFPLIGRIYDGFSNKFADKIIVSSSNQLNYLIEYEKVDLAKISILEFGFDLSKYANPDENRITDFHKKYKIESSRFVIGIVSRIQDVKGLQYSIHAVSKFLQIYPDALLILANAADASVAQLQFITDLIPDRNLLIIDRESQMSSVYHSFDVLIHVPVDPMVESYGLVYVEAFASGLSTIITKSGVANEIAQHEFNCLLVDYCNSEQILSNLILLSSSDELRIRLGKNAQESVKHLSLVKMQKKYKDFLENQLSK